MWKRGCYLAATFSCSICTATGSSLLVASLAVRSCDVALALDALWGKKTSKFLLSTTWQALEEGAECVLPLCFTKQLTPKWKCCHYLLTPMSTDNFRQTPEPEFFCFEKCKKNNFFLNFLKSVFLDWFSNRAKNKTTPLS